MTKKLITLSIVLFISLLVGTKVYCQTVHDTSPKILVLGDSISAGYGVISGKGWVDLLQEKLRSQKKSYQIVNASISGETSFGGLARIRSLLEKNHPELVILELGANDSLRGFRVEEIEINLQKIISLNQQYGAITLLVGMKIPNNYGPQYTLELEKMYQRLAKTNRISLIPFLLEKFALKREFFQDDGIHPTTQAQPLIVQTVEEKLMPLLKQIKN